MNASERSVVCESCGKAFGCGVDTGSCWCSRVEMGAGELHALDERFDDCLCPDCLAAASRAESPPPAVRQAT